MQGVSYSDYLSIYGNELNEAAYNRLGWQAERIMDIQTTGIDNVHKLDIAFPTVERDADAVKRCYYELIHKAHEIEDYVSRATSAGGHGAVASRSSGSESISYVRVQTEIDDAAGDLSARNRLFFGIVKNYLSGISDANGVNILFMGEYPCIRTQ